MTTQRVAMLGTLGNTALRCNAFVLTAWRALNTSHLLYVSLLALAWSGIEMAPRIAMILPLPSWSPVFNGVLGMQFNALAVTLAVVIANRASPPSLRRWWPYVLAVVAGVIVGSSLFWVVSQRILGIATAVQLRGLPDGYDTFAFRQAVHGLLVCGLATYVYVSYRFASRRLAALRTVQLERAGVEKRVLESRLAAMQARVEPQFLLDTLARVERLYDTDVPAADRALTNLTRYLRAAIPQTGDPGSTVTREIVLTNAFLNVVAPKSKDRLLVGGDRSSIWDRARMPPMILLPLIKHALAHRVEHAQGSEWFWVDVVVCEDRLRLTIRDQGSGFASQRATDAELQQIRDRLGVLYGDSAQFLLKDTADGTEAVVEIPYETVADAMPA